MSAPQTPAMVLVNWCLVGVIAALLLVSYLLDGPDDIKTAQAVAEDAEYGASLADGGAAKCSQYGRMPIWTASGNLICRLPTTSTVQEARL